MNVNQNVVPYQFDGRNVRCVERDGDIWFVATDIARELGYGHTPHLLRNLDDDEKGVHGMDTPGGPQEIVLVSEPGLYRAIVQRRANQRRDASMSDRIERFQRWVFHDVLPSIRKTGGFGDPEPPARDPMEVLNDPAAMRGILLTYTEKVIALETENAVLAPAKAALDRIAEADGSLCITDAAKALQVAPKALFGYLRLHGWIYRRAGAAHDVGYQDKVNAGLLEHKVSTFTRPDGTERITEQVRVTPKGLAKLAQALSPKKDAA